MTTEEKNLTTESAAPKDGSKDEVVELSVDEQSHVAGGAVDTFLKLGHKISEDMRRR